ncbi:MAG: MBL fold metallo-hydrolase [PS1 clade bacterium]|uniref:MBL fold metallo-hydrolase n=1 Tax=PS1 clade bacterium TaxID=2175152 RepID=A0A368E0I9_9PROT|nr:MAG: MBL fold metallo-hydrolase [PS1 clade bacterium]|tara:strand:+ start:1247 stop:2995 length:1749 start_codon:yes stop_codon:yes gene_type:complete
MKHVSRLIFFSFLLTSYLTVFQFSAYSEPHSHGAHRHGAHPGLKKHVQQFKNAELIEVAKGVYWAQFFDYSNYGFIEGDNEILAVDCGWWPSATQKALTELRKQTKKPITRIVFTHGHADHVAGCSAYINEGNVREIISSEDYIRYRDEMITTRLPFIARRATDQMGLLLPKSLAGDIGTGVGFAAYGGKASYFPPTKLIQGGDTLSFDGLELAVLEAPADIDDHIVFFDEKRKILYAGDSYINVGPPVASPRNEKGRDPIKWMNTLDMFLSLQPEIVLPGHGKYDNDKAKIASLLKDSRDTIKFIDDYIVRGLINEIPRDELIADIKLPDNLASNPELQFYYHSLKWVARGVYTNYAGWYRDDIRDLFETHPTTEAKELVGHLGGPDNVIKIASTYRNKEQYGLAGRLLGTTHIAFPDHQGVKEMLIDTMRQEAFRSESSSQRNYLLTSAAKIEGTYDKSQMRPFIGFKNLLESVPNKKLVEFLSIRINPNKIQEALDENEANAIRLKVLPDADTFALYAGNEVIVVSDHLEGASDIEVSITKSDLVALALQRVSFDELLKTGKLSSNNTQMARKFFALFD